MNAIETRQLTKSFGRQQSLLPLDFTVPQGAIYALAGHNGAGKTTLLKLLLNILQPTAGSATILGQTSTALTGEAFTRIGYVAEGQEMPEWMTVRVFMDYLRPFYSTWDEGTLLRDLDLPEDRRIKHLSRGMRMKLALAGTLAFRPQLILMDEPFAGLDPLVRDELPRTLLDRLSADDAALPTVLISTHDLAEIEPFATHIAMLDHGRMLFAEPMEQLTARFREVTLTVQPQTVLPSQLPMNWLTPQRTLGSLRFVHSGETSLEEDIRRALPTAQTIEAEPMSLRDIFLALTRTDDRSRA